MRIRTVLGDLPGQKMGFSDTHEHVYCKMPEWVKDRTLEIADITKSTQELSCSAKAAAAPLWRDAA